MSRVPQLFYTLAVYDCQSSEETSYLLCCFYKLQCSRTRDVYFLYRHSSGNPTVSAAQIHAREDSFDNLGPEEIAASLLGHPQRQNVGTEAWPKPEKYAWPEGNSGWIDSPVSSQSPGNFYRSCLFIETLSFRHAFW